MNVLAKQRETQLSVQDFVEQNAVQRADITYLIDPDTGASASFKECQEKIIQIASAIAETGAKPGDRIAYAFSNSVDSALIILAILYGGYHATSINLVAGENTISYVLEHSESSLIIADDDAAKLLEPILQQNPVSPQLMMKTDIMKSKRMGKISNVTADTDGLLMYTSGTTGRPKGVVLTQANLIAGGMNTANAHQLSECDRGLCVLPFYHINAFCVSLMASLVSGSSLVIPRKFSVKNFWEIVRQNQCSWFSVVPTQISYLLHNADKDDASGCDALRFGRSASAPLSPDVHSAFEKRFNVPIIETMGLTETAAPILSNPLPPGTCKIGSPGIAFGNEVMIGDVNQQEVNPNEEGEILVRGDNVLRCYLKNEEATAEAITNEGWLRTGDLGRMDADGYVFVTGRLKELIIKGGENIAPREVDEALYTHPDVVEAAAFAVDCSDYGQRIEAGVKLAEGSIVTAQDLLSVCAERIGKFKSPDKIHFLPELPKGPSGKIQRIKLAELFAS